MALYGDPLIEEIIMLVAAWQQELGVALGRPSPTESASAAAPSGAAG